MTRIVQTKTSFAAGELDPVLFGRLDLRAQQEGAAKLRNVVVRPTGGVCRRPGTRFVQELAGGDRLTSFDNGNVRALVAVAPSSIQVIEEKEVVSSFHGLPWTLEQIQHLAWVQFRDRILFVHPEIEPILLIRKPSGWEQMQGLPWQTGSDGRLLQPFARYADSSALLALHHIDGVVIDGPASGIVDIVASDAVFSIDHVGTVIRYRGVEIDVSQYKSANRLSGTLVGAVDEANATQDWSEQAFSGARGWPATSCFHQDRLVFGGSRDLPNYVWISKTGDYFNFDLGQGLDDQAIAFRLNSDHHEHIRAVFPGRRLQIFTGNSEWVVNGSPLTPANVSVDLQTRVGSLGSRRISPVDVDGATLFIGASGRDLREFIFSDSEQAYQAADLALLSRHLMIEPRDLCFDRHSRQIVVVRSDGAAALVAIDRNSNVVAWSQMELAGELMACCVQEGFVYFLSRVNGTTMIEEFDPDLGLDHAIQKTASIETQAWLGFSPLEGMSVTVVGDDDTREQAQVVGGTIITSGWFRKIEAGLAFEHEIEPLPLTTQTRSGADQSQLYRPIKHSFRLSETEDLNVETESGTTRNVLRSADAGGAFSGDVRLSAYGWRRAYDLPTWRIHQDMPTPFCLLSVTSEIKVNN